MQNTVYGKRKNVATPGIPDIIGFTNSGLFVGREVKKIGDKFSKEQIEFLTRLHAGGGISLYAVEEKGKVIIKNFDGDQTVLKKAASLKQGLF
ncbi:hypothetical protein AXF24_12490 [Streptococcus pneumoniae]|uniref:hypothetical protein n=1 Tax=Streptococcus pneumoniae TaxID=1313 RepID=UPI000772D321|nr:hypothetical protein AWW74_12505 [Streptococcus pneumoniae]KXB94709.1 hypothetical protein AXF24_12490 [Streptococcus pneumoniae]